MIQVNLSLNLSKIKKSIRLEYSTFEKSAFDQYLIASFLKNSESNSVESHIDKITGKGSLNAHFKNILTELSKFNPDQIDNILNDSMYPVVHLNDNLYYIYFDQLDVSLFNNNVYKGDLSSHTEFINGDLFKFDGKLISCNVVKEERTIETQRYNVELGESIKVSITNKKDFVPINNVLFAIVLQLDKQNVNLYNGDIFKNISGNDWKVLTSSFNDISKGKVSFYDNGNLFVIDNNRLQKISVGEISGIYFFKNDYMNFNKEISTKVIMKLIEDDSLRSLDERNSLNIINACDVDLQIISYKYLLNIKETQSIYTRVTKLINNGYIEWDVPTIKKVINDIDKKNIQNVYLKYNTIQYDIKQLIKIDKDKLRDNDKTTIEQYENDKTIILDVINSKIGEISTSGLRESSKKLKGNKDTQEFSKLCNKILAHNLKNYSNLSLDELKIKVIEVEKFYDVYKRVKLYSEEVKESK
ncbi:MAG: hypothetical protein R3Y05_03755 [bacterium]